LHALFTEGSIRGLMTRMGLAPTRMARPSTIVARAEDEFTVAEIAAQLNMPEGTIYSWLYKQRLTARRVEAADRSLWLVRLGEVQQLLSQRGAGGRLPTRQPS
jgi:excisionase family DNA binding protein